MVRPRVEEAFGFASVQVLDFADLYAGMEALLVAGNLDPVEFSTPPGGRTRSAEARRPAERSRRVRSAGAAARNPA